MDQELRHSIEDAIQQGCHSAARLRQMRSQSVALHLGLWWRSWEGDGFMHIRSRVRIRLWDSPPCNWSASVIPKCIRSGGVSHKSTSQKWNDEDLPNQRISTSTTTRNSTESAISRELSEWIRSFHIVLRMPFNEAVLSRLGSDK